MPETTTEKPRWEHPARAAKRVAFAARRASENILDRDGERVLPVPRRGQVLILAIALYVDATGVTSIGGRGGPSQRLLGALVGYSERAVRMAVKELDAAGMVLRSVPSPGERRAGQRTEYKIPLWAWRADPGDPASSSAEARGSVGGAQEAVARRLAAGIDHRTPRRLPAPVAAAERSPGTRTLGDRAAGTVGTVALAAGVAAEGDALSARDRQPLPVPKEIPIGYPPSPRGGAGTAAAAPSAKYPQASETLAQLRAAVAARSR